MSERRRASVLRYRCKACESNYVKYRYFSDFEYGMLNLYCDQCGNQAAVDADADPVWDLLETKHKLEFGTDTNKPEKIDIFYGWFEGSCDKCSCGGTYRLPRGSKELCVKCRSDNVEMKNPGPDELEEREVPWVTHNDWFEKHPPQNVKPA